MRLAFQAADRGDVDGVLRFFAPDAVWDASVNALGVFEGAEAIRGFVEDWQGTYEDYGVEVEEILDLGSGVVFAVYRESGRPAGSEGLVQEERCWVAVFADGLVSTLTFHQHIDEGRAAAERLAKERADG